MKSGIAKQVAQGLAGCLVLAAVPCLAAPDDVIVAAVDLPRPAVEVTGSSVPRFDGTPRASRLDLVLLPEQRSGMGVALGLNQPARNAQAFSVAPGFAQSMDLGLHWRYTFDSQYRFDVSAYRRVPNGDAISLIESREPSYGARLEMGLGALHGPRKGFVAERGFLGVQLEGGARLTVKRSGGVPMLYYRNSFY